MARCLLIVFVLLVASSRAANKRLDPTVDKFELRNSQTAKPVEKRNVSAQNLLKELGIEKKQIIKEEIFNETDTVRICWKDIIFVNQSGSELTQWQEVYIVFHFPDDEDVEVESHPPEYLKYGLQQDPQKVQPVEFEVIENHPNYTISKHEHVTCGSGKYLTKSFYEWPNSDKKKIVLRLTDEFKGFSYDRDDFIDLKIKNRPYNVVKMEHPVLKFRNLNNSQEDEENTDAHHSDDENELKPPILGHSYSHLERKYEEASLEDHAETEANKTGHVENKILASVEPCSPLLTQLLSGTGVLNGLCNLKKDQTVVLKGTIVVSKKYFNEQNQTEVLKPMFVIRENAEIEPISEFSKENDDS